MKTFDKNQIDNLNTKILEIESKLEYISKNIPEESYSGMEHDTDYLEFTVEMLGKDYERINRFLKYFDEDLDNIIKTIRRIMEKSEEN